jgi:hypothetical protein
MIHFSQLPRQMAGKSEVLPVPILSNVMLLPKCNKPVCGNVIHVSGFRRAYLRFLGRSVGPLAGQFACHRR